jgi:hypothetical protein
MNKPTRAALQLLRAILALLAVLWIFSWLGVFLKIAEPGYFAEHWLRVLLAFAATFVPVWGYTKLTKLLALPKPYIAENADADRKA